MMTSIYERTIMAEQKIEKNPNAIAEVATAAATVVVMIPVLILDGLFSIFDFS